MQIVLVYLPTGEKFKKKKKSLVYRKKNKKLNTRHFLEMFLHTQQANLPYLKGGMKSQCLNSTVPTFLTAVECFVFIFGSNEY